MIWAYAASRTSMCQNEYSRSPSHRRRPDRAEELLLRELVEGLADLDAVAIAHRLEGTRPEDLPDHRCVLQEPLAIGRQRVEPGRDDPVDALRERELRTLRQLPGLPPGDEQAAILQHPDELLRIERVPSGPLDDRALHVER